MLFEKDSQIAGVHLEKLSRGDRLKFWGGGGISSLVPHLTQCSLCVSHFSLCHSHSCLLPDGHPRLGLGAELCKGSNELDTVQRREMAVRMERKIVGKRRKHLDANTGKCYDVLCVRNICDFSSPSVFIKYNLYKLCYCCNFCSKLVY